MNIRITDEDDRLLDRLLEAERRELAARCGDAPTISRADVVRWAIRDRARLRGLLEGRPALVPPQGGGGTHSGLAERMTALLKELHSRHEYQEPDINRMVAELREMMGFSAK